MSDRRGRFAAILWDISADIDDAIDLVRTFEKLLAATLFAHGPAVGR